MDDNELMSAGQAAAYLGITRQRLDELAQAGRIRRQRVGRNYVYRRSDLDVFKAEGPGKPGRPKDELATSTPAALVM
jgi:excisionase family DNA binding protein